jgi:hypothetical protein
LTSPYDVCAYISQLLCNYSYGPNETTDTLTHQSIFINAVGYACDNYNYGCKSMDVNMTNGKILKFQEYKFYSTFKQSLVTLQKATCLYWPYGGTLEQLDPKLKATLGFKKLSAEELQAKILESGSK